MFDYGCCAAFAVQGPGDELVWRQVLHLNLDHKDPAVAHQAAVTLATEAS